MKFYRKNPTKSGYYYAVDENEPKTMRVEWLHSDDMGDLVMDRGCFDGSGPLVSKETGVLWSDPIPEPSLDQFTDIFPEKEGKYFLKAKGEDFIQMRRISKDKDGNWQVPTLHSLYGGYNTLKKSIQPGATKWFYLELPPYPLFHEII